MKERSLKAAIFVSLALFCWKALLPGWMKQTTDFPNYYTAARLVRAGMPLRQYYDWIWFQRQIEYAGSEGELGGYIPQTPLAMMPVLPLSSLKPQTAKRWWLLLNLLFLAAAIHLLSRITGFRRIWLSLLIIACWEPLRANFLLGQYYVLLLLLFTIAAYSLARDRDASSGFAAGIAFGLKLYGAPLLIWFAARRQWRAVTGMAAATAACIWLELAVFGWPDVAYFATQILPRALQGETLNPFHPGNATLSTLLRIAFLAEPQLNPHPPIHSAGAFFFLQPLVALIVLALPLLSAGTFAWFLIALLLASPNTASYTFIVLALPVALLLRSSPRRRWPWLLIPYAAIGLPIPAGWIWAFPRLWLMFMLYFEAGRGQWKTIRPRYAVMAGVCIVPVAATSAVLHMRGYRTEPDQTTAVALSDPGGVYSAFPVVTAAGLIYQSISQQRFVLRRYRDGRTETFVLPGQAFTPSAPVSGAPIYFEFATDRISQIAALHPDSGRIDILPLKVPNPREPAISCDGKLLVFVSGDSLFLFDGVTTHSLPTPVPVADPSFVPGDRGIVFSVSTSASSRIYLYDLDTNGVRTMLSHQEPVARPSVSPDKSRIVFASPEMGSWHTGAWQIWVADSAAGQPTRLTGGNCNNSMPAWDSASDQIIFASDCGRGLGLPALYRTGHIAGPVPRFPE